MRRLINQAGLSLIKQFEQGPDGGPALVAYRDPGGVWTLGWGRTGGIYKGDTCSLAQAEYMLAQDLGKFEDWVTARTQNPTDNQFAAMVSLTFNIGETAFLRSSVRRYHNEGNFSAAAGAFLLFDKEHIDGQLVTSAGLLSRRRAEEALYLQG